MICVKIINKIILNETWPLYITLNKREPLLKILKKWAIHRSLRWQVVIKISNSSEYVVRSRYQHCLKILIYTNMLCKCGNILILEVDYDDLSKKSLLSKKKLPYFIE